MSGTFERRVSAWEGGLVRTLLERDGTGAVYEPEDYVPGDDAAMDDLECELIDAGLELFLATEAVPVALLVNLVDLRIPTNPTNVFGAIHIVPDEDRERLQLIGICTPMQSDRDLADYRNRVPGSRLMRAHEACAQLGLTLTVHRTRRGHHSLSVQRDLGEDDLTFRVNLREGTGWDRPMEQLEGFGRALGQVSDALQGPAASQARGGCYIATAVYGSYDAPQVITLREFRDSTLERSRAGRLLIRLYYAASPPIADRLRRADRANRAARTVLDLLVSSLERRVRSRGARADDSRR